MLIFQNLAPNSGDVETYNNIMARGEKICHKPEYISQLECRSETHPEVSIQEIGQVVECNRDYGLVCRNQDQKGKFKMCFNYEIRVLCCEPMENCSTTTTTSVTTKTSHEITTNFVPSTTTVPETSTYFVPSTATSPETTPHSVLTATTSPPSSPLNTTISVSTSIQEHSSTSPVTKPPTSHPMTPASTSTQPIPPNCEPQCSWTKWFDVDFPSSGPNSGDVETYNNIIRRGEKICHKPDYITRLECRARDHPHVNIEKIGQVVECNPDYGLVCRNQDQKGKYKMCFNYEIRVLCCEPMENCSATTATSPTTPTTTSVTTKTSHEITTNFVPSTTTSPETTSPSVLTTTTSPLTTTISVSTATQEHSSTSPVTTRTKPSTSHPMTPSSTHVQPPSPTCEPQCSWTKWFDVDFPKSGPNSGDVETYNNIMARGEKICHKPEYISQLECRSETHPEVSIQEIGQVVECNRDYGLVCRNQDQKGKFKMCFNYEIRVLCCEPMENCSTTTATSPTTPTTTSVTTKTSHEITTNFVPSTTTVPETSTYFVTTTTTTATSPETSTIIVPETSTYFVPSTTTVPETSTYFVPSTATVPETSTYFVTTPTPTVPETSTYFVTATTATSPETSTDFVPFTTTVPVPFTTTVPETTSPSVLTTTTSPLTTTISVSTATQEHSSTSPITTRTKPSTSHPMTPSSTYVQPPSPTCEPQCSWTKWFDVDFPKSGPNSGDVETYNNIMARGEKICHKPEYISQLECRSETHPEVSIQEIGQVVECNRDYGLVCRNQDQKGKFKMCFNYEIRVLCCEPMENCSTTPTPTSMTTISRTTSVTTSTPSTMTPTIYVATSSTPLSTHTSTPCFCFLSGKVYPSGTLIYNRTDNAGHCYSAICNDDCTVERRAEVCSTSVAPPVPTTPTSGSTPESTPTSPSVSPSHPPATTGKTGSDCLNVVPPRKKGETWLLHKCQKATCEGDNVITLSPVSCPAVKKVACANGYPPVKVYDDADHCCYHYECQCVCSGWGDPHYITFDGVYYTFLDNCTYVLVQQIYAIYGHFRVLIDNYFCDARDGLSCPRSIIVEYRDNRIVLTRALVRGVMENEIIFNNRTIGAGFKQDGIVISTLGINMYVTIPEIGVQVMFSGLLFSVEVPFTKFANNTEGQCGTCTNDKRDECRLPDGKVVSSCSEMSGSWKYSVPGQPYCAKRPPPTPTAPPTTPRPCPPSPLCLLIMSEVFEPCHSIVPPQFYFEGCVYDQCHIPEARVGCSGLELYASLCAAQGLCIDWRGETHGQCSFTCPADKVYQACGPIYPPTCQSPEGSLNTSLTLAEDLSRVTEGCFCPAGTTLFSLSSKVCVRATPSECQSWCTGPHGEPVQPGTVVFSDPCKTCSCDPEGSPESRTHSIQCNVKVCETHCPLGYRMEKVPGKCCGICVPFACVVHSNGSSVHSNGSSVHSNGSSVHSNGSSVHSNGSSVHSNDSSVHLVQPGETWSSPGDKCVQYECERVNGQLILVTVKKACPPALCSPEQVRWSEDGCCLVCPPPPQVYHCDVGRRTQVIRKGGCSSTSPVEVTYCQGNCGDTTSIYSFKSNVLEHSCKCCRELRTSQRNVSLSCPDGSSLAVLFTQVEECGCQHLRCDDVHGGRSDEDSGESEAIQEQSQEQGPRQPPHGGQALRWRRATHSLQPQR
uniref:Mucin-5AC-like n=1 Tax=Monodelphis domestica TaxID=13616 RepID=H9H910_MONDO